MIAIYSHRQDRAGRLRPRSSAHDSARAGRRWLVLTLSGMVVLGAPEARAVSSRIVLDVGGVARTATIVEHQRLKRGRRPVVVVLRRGATKELRPRRFLGTENAAWSSKRILVFPDPLDGRWSASAAQDVGFVRDLVTRLVGDGRADPRRIFVVGIADGGATALRLACDPSALVAGAAVLSGGLPEGLAASCSPKHPIALLVVPEVAGLEPSPGSRAADSAGPAAHLRGLETMLTIFGGAAGCDGKRTTTPLPDRDPHDGTRAYLDRLDACAVPVEVVRVEGSTHPVPDRRSVASDTVPAVPRRDDLDRAKLVIDFLRRAGG